LNLHDIVIRADRMLGCPLHPVEAMEEKLPGAGQRAARLAAGGDGLLLKDAREAAALLTSPACPGRVVQADFLAQLSRDSLRDRGYSIHVNYYSAGSFRHLLQLFGENHPLDGIFMESATNGKDFGFLIAKPS